MTCPRALQSRSIRLRSAYSYRLRTEVAAQRTSSPRGTPREPAPGRGQAATAGCLSRGPTGKKACPSGRGRTLRDRCRGQATSPGADDCLGLPGRPGRLRRDCQGPYAVWAQRSTDCVPAASRHCFGRRRPVDRAFDRPGARCLRGPYRRPGRAAGPPVHSPKSSEGASRPARTRGRCQGTCVDLGHHLAVAPNAFPVGAPAIEGDCHSCRGSR